ncbi:MAG: polyphosphate kinase 1 [Eubacteriales bacterium]|nr:polyphosphate kinase 1 [Eubacteriales bacterium]
MLADKNNCYTNRELSWLSFNMRVLNEAANPRVPLAERLTFASIYQTNLDEFFMVRVGTLMTQMNSPVTIYENKTGMSSREQVEAILAQTKKQEKTKAQIFEQLMGELEPKGIRIINFQRLSQEEQEVLEQYFDSHIAPFLSPMVISRQNPFPFLNNKDLYAVVLLSTKKGKDRVGIVPCKNTVFNRLIELPTRPGTFMLSEELILHFIGKLYRRFTIREKSVLRITRNADIDAIEIYDEDLDYRGQMEQLIKKRKRLSPVRVELSRDLDKKTIKELSSYLSIDKNYFIHVDTPLDLSFVFAIQKKLQGNPELFYEKRTPRYTPAIDLNQPILPQIEKKDVLLSYPYQSMKPFIAMLQEAARDPSVISIKMTLYRVAEEHSQIIEALTEAAENGKEVIVMVELRARFDEENNIDVSRQLQEAGCQIIYGLEKYKVHSKLTLITKMTENRGSFYYTQIGTGNYNEKTAKLYTDFALLTANQELGAEVSHVFSDLQKGETVEEIQHLLVAPKCMQNRILDMMDEQIVLAKQGDPDAYIGAKINSLTDKKIIEKIIEASQAGVKIDLIVRGICCLRPKVPGYTENVTVISIVGRFLEHSRIYIFGKGDHSKVYISSADFMTRNTVRRVEAAAPVYDPDVKSQILRMFSTKLRDDEKGKEQDENAVYHDRKLSDPPMNSQEYFYQRAYALDPTLPESEKH